ncbi:MAG: polysaccharide deacetylase family protein [Pirellulaceae bacterium]|nr:polysaccharide deacetylase family protein [Pirellulaceae bacterium]
MPARPPASLSLDLDNKWSYMKTHGDEGWQSWPSYLNMVVPRILDFFQQRNTKITVFIVGQDAEQTEHHDVLRQIADAGHEIGNHSYHHEPWLHLYSDPQLLEEFQRSEAAIEQATGQRPQGFRGPGFSFSDAVLNILAQRGYLYDASTFPTYLGPVARAYYFFTSQLNRSEKEDRKQLFGKLSDGFRPIKPFVWSVGEHDLLEIPVTTMPIFKLPIHASYFFYLATFSRALARFYFWVAIKLCWLTGVRPSFLLHPLDFMDQQDVPELAFFPGMKFPADQKTVMLNGCFDLMEKHWSLGPMRAQAKEAMKGRLGRKTIPVMDLKRPS